jgi:hypothetical protein
MGKLTVDTTSADLFLDTREFDKFKFDTVSGSLNADCITARIFRMKSTSVDLIGDIISDKAVCLYFYGYNPK